MWLKAFGCRSAGTQLELAGIVESAQAAQPGFVPAPCGHAHPGQTTRRNRTVIAFAVIPDSLGLDRAGPAIRC